MESFYLTLPCSVKGIYHENLLSDYVTHLPRTIELEDKWEVALVEFHFTKSWYNIDQEMIIGVRTTDNCTQTFANGKLEPGKYSVEYLFNEINRLLQTTESEISVARAPFLGREVSSLRARILPGESDRQTVLIPHFPDELYDLLGLSKPPLLSYEYDDLHGKSTDSANIGEIVTVEKDIIETHLFGYRAIDIEKGIYSIFVYSDIVEENLIGDTSVRCLRVCTLPQAEFGETVNLTFEQPHYLPLSRRTFNTVRVTLKDKTNDKIKFQFGETLIKLHFKKC